MNPASSVSGLIIGHKLSSYFAVGAIDKTQMSDYAKRNNASEDVMERWLAPILS